MMCFSSRRWSLRDKDRFCSTVARHKRDVWSLIRLWSIWNINYCNIWRHSKSHRFKIWGRSKISDEMLTTSPPTALDVRTVFYDEHLLQGNCQKWRVGIWLQDLVILLHLFFCGPRALKFFGYISQSTAEMVWVMYYNKVYHKGLWFPIANFG